MVSTILQSVRNLHKIRSKELYSNERLRDYQFHLLKKTLHFASEKIPYYREIFQKSGIHAAGIKTWEDFEKVPVLTKEDLRAHSPELFLPDGIDKKKIWKSETTGSSGIPITVYRNSGSVAWDRALIHYCFENLGIRFYHRFCQVLAHVSNKPQPLGPLAKLGFKRNFVVDLRQNDAQIALEIRKLKPDAICTYPSVFLRLAEYLKSQGMRIKTRWLIAQGEVLPEPWRATIEEAFGAPLYHTYGSTEFARVAFECREKKGYHLIPDAAVVEISSNGKAAADYEEGEMIVTNLNNFCFPLIRYKIGDRAIRSSKTCACGIRYPLLESITGRLDDFLVLPSGKRVSARAVTHMQFEGITQYKVIQKSPSHLQVMIVPSKSYGEKTVEDVEKILAGAFFGEPVKVEISKREKLPLSRTGKLQLVSREF